MTDKVRSSKNDCQRSGTNVARLSNTYSKHDITLKHVTTLERRATNMHIVYRACKFEDQSSPTPATWKMRRLTEFKTSSEYYKQKILHIRTRHWQCSWFGGRLPDNWRQRPAKRIVRIKTATHKWSMTVRVAAICEQRVMKVRNSGF